MDITDWVRERHQILCLHCERPERKQQKCPCEKFLGCDECEERKDCDSCEDRKSDEPMVDESRD